MTPLSQYPIPEIALQQHLAILAKTGAGKTTTAKGVVEHVVIEDDARVCILDPIKSDWWGLISSADGKKPGLPFNILGGPHGHVPLNASAGKAVGELVGSGALPLSIVDMADFEPGGIQRFFSDFAPALMKAMRGVLYLVLEEAHEFCPKERAGFGNENMSIHFAKKLATAGRSKGIRLIVVTHRVQSLHNAVLGSCDTLIAQRLTAPADQEPVVKWLKANASKDVVDKVSGSLSSLPTGSGWIVSGEARVFERVTFPMITTFDNSRTPTKDSAAPTAVTTAAIDLDKLRSLLEAAAPKESLGAGKAGGPGAEAKASAPSVDALAAADKRGYDRGFEEGVRRGVQAGFSDAKSQLLDLVGSFVISNEPTIPPPAAIADAPAPVALARTKPPTTKQRFDGDNIGPAAEKLIAALVRYPLGLPSWQDVCIAAGMSHGNGYFYGGRKSLTEFGLAVEGSGRVTATVAGRERVDNPGGALTLDELIGIWSPKLKSPGPQMLAYIARVGSASPQDLAAATGIKPGNGFWYGGIASIRDVGLVTADKSRIALAPLLQAAKDGRVP